MNTQKAYIQSPIGWIELTASDTHLCGMLWLEKVPDNKISMPEHPILKEAEKQINEYFSGTRKEFTLSLQQKGTSFQQTVWDELLKIPYGETITYKELAIRTGNPNACRAVGSANGKNGIFILVPCHRVVQSGGKLGGYAYGLEMKRFLLKLENAMQNPLFK